MTFRSHLDGSEHILSPEKALEIEIALGADIMMVLDECIETPATEERARDAAKRTLDWARRSQDYFQGHGDSARQMLFGIVQGGTLVALRRESADALVELDFPGYAIGGLAVGEPHATHLRDGGSCGVAFARGAAALPDGSGQSRANSGLRGAGSGHDGLRAAHSQRAARMPVHFARALAHQKCASIRTIRGRSTKHVVARFAGAILVRTFGTLTCGRDSRDHPEHPPQHLLLP